ncbi:hypothetical protein JL720_4497 [Aureococcus anophagefferens]|nr:hypothetical protein JL720_4497 [Aureococcus anophagefferens]
MGKCGSKPQVVASKQPPGKEPAPLLSLRDEPPPGEDAKAEGDPPRGDTPYMTFRGGAFIDEALARRAYPDRVTEMVASLEKFEAFRRRFGLDELANDEPRARADCARLLNFWDNMKFCGYDAYGHPVITETVHETLARVNLADEDPEDLLKGRTVCTEAFIALKHLATRRHNSDVTVLKQVLIVDMDRVRLRMVTSRVRSRFKVIMKTLEDVYPEVAWRTYVVNCQVVAPPDDGDEARGAYGAPAAAEPLEAPRVAAPPRARKAPSDAKKAELAAEAAASTTGYLGLSPRSRRGRRVLAA